MNAKIEKRAARASARDGWKHRFPTEASASRILSNLALSDMFVDAGI